MFTLAHLSDPHLGPLPPVPFRNLLSKRFFGYVNWHRGRGRALAPVALAALTERLRELQPDHIAVTGDLVNIAAELEFVAGRQWLDSLGKPHDVTVVPGNHDAYVPGATARFEHQWLPYMLGDGGDPIGVSYPFVRERGPVALIGLSSAIATPPLFATGRIGPGQVTALRQTLRQLGEAGRFRVILIHHPPFATWRDWFRRLIGNHEFRAAVAEAGAELVLHGHDHSASLHWIDGAAGRTPVVGVPSASNVPGGLRPAATFNLFRIENDSSGFRCTLSSHQLDDDGRVKQVSETRLAG